MAGHLPGVAVDRGLAGAPVSRNADPTEDIAMWVGILLCAIPWILIAEWFGGNGIAVAIWLLILAYPLALVGLSLAWVVVKAWEITHRTR